MLSTAWLMFFAVVWWVYTPHDGRVEVNSAAQKEVQDSGPGHDMSEEERVAAAMSIWNAEKGIATAMLVVGWLLKVRPTSVWVSRRLVSGWMRLGRTDCVACHMT